MKQFTLVLLLASLALGLHPGPCLSQEFDPTVDGWHFENFGTDDLSWDIFRRTYSGVSQAEDCVSAALDCAFYEIFTQCAGPGNCGGMSLLALALYKHGGYLGYCSPACFYAGGTDGPDRDDLAEAINAMQARQFSAPGILNFLDICDAGDMNNAERAYNDVKAALAKGDYPVLSIATDYIGGSAHTVIPYRVEESGGQKRMFIWDSNFPSDDHPSRYLPTSTNQILTINGPTNWSYAGQTTYSGAAGGGWCFCVPMSIVMSKHRHPLQTDLILNQLSLMFISGMGSVSQVEDAQGRRLYRTAADVHTSRSEFEDNPAARLPGFARWPWFGQTRDDMPELYVGRRRGGGGDLTITMHGESYGLRLLTSDCILEVECQSTTTARDVIRVSRKVGEPQTLSFSTHAPSRRVKIRQLWTGVRPSDWKRYEIANLLVTEAAPVEIAAFAVEGAVEVICDEGAVEFDLILERGLGGELTRREVGRLTAPAGERLRIMPENWQRLEGTEVRQTRRAR
jgi:hypothetical protein